VQSFATFGGLNYHKCGSSLDAYAFRVSKVMVSLLLMRRRYRLPWMAFNQRSGSTRVGQGGRLGKVGKAMRGG
jgi:hypothetical protein